VEPGCSCICSKVISTGKALDKVTAKFIALFAHGEKSVGISRRFIVVSFILTNLTAKSQVKNDSDQLSV
jgi:hypothetical protein